MFDSGAADSLGGSLRAPGRRALAAIWRIPTLVVAVITALVQLPGLGAAPWLDPPEGFHAEARYAVLAMVSHGYSPPEDT